MMIYRAVKDCTDFDGRHYSAGEEAELPESARHSAYLVPRTSAPKTAEPVKSPTRRKKK